MTPLLTTAEAAAYFRRTARTILRWVREEKIRPMEGTRPYLFHPEELERVSKRRMPVRAY